MESRVNAFIIVCRNILLFLQKVDFWDWRYLKLTKSKMQEWAGVRGGAAKEGGAAGVRGGVAEKDGRRTLSLCEEATVISPFPIASTESTHDGTNFFILTSAFVTRLTKLLK